MQNTACNLTDVRAQGVPVGVRELFAFTPWYYSDGQDPLIPRSAVSTYLPMWDQLLDTHGYGKSHIINQNGLPATQWFRDVFCYGIPAP